MKILYISSWVLLLTGVFFRLIHLPAGGEFLYSGAILSLIHSTIFMLKNAKSNLYYTLFYFSITFMMLYFIGRFQFMAWAKVPFMPACIVMITGFILLLKRKTKFRAPQIFQLLIFIAIVYFSYIPSYKIYYFIHLNTILNSETRKINYAAWDQYCWFLYLHDKEAEAFMANQVALHAVAESMKDTSDLEAARYASIIRQHKFQMEHKQWTEFP